MTSASSRIAAIDVLRGLTIAGMLLVNDPGDADHVFAPLRHSAWHGCTFADLVFPSFLFVLGVTTHLSLSRQADASTNGDVVWAIWRRAAILFGIGLLINAYPFFEKQAVAGPESLPMTLRHVMARLASLRIMGVLQRIGIVYLVTALIARRCANRGVILAIVVLLVGYWLLLTLVPVPGLGTPNLDDPAQTLAAWVDRLLLDWTRFGYGWHLWDRAVAYDPEGLLSTIPAVGTALLGVLAGRWLMSARPLMERVTRLATAGGTLVLLGLAWSLVFPINKPLWTSSYVLFTGGVVTLTLSATMWMVDVRMWRGWTSPWLAFGTNPIAVYVGAELLASILRSSIKWRVDERLVGIPELAVRALDRFGVPTTLASLVWALVFTALCYGLVRPLYRRGIFLRV